MEINPGDILHVYCVFIPKYKYVICVCPQKPLFFLINSLPRRITPDAQIMIKKNEFPFLDGDSYINTATLCTIYQNEINKSKKVGFLPNHVRAEIVSVVKTCKYLPPIHKELIENNLSPNK